MIRALTTLSILSSLVACAPQDTSALEDHFFLRTDGADLRVQVDGNLDSDVLILMLHGGPGGSGHEYNMGLYTELLEQRYAMAYWDQRGQGGSRGAYDPEVVTIDQLSRDTEALVDLLHARYGEDLDIVMMGHSWGGTLGTAALLDTDIQDELAAWIEVDGAHDIPQLNRYAIDMFIEVGQAQLDAGKNKGRWREMVRFAEGLDPDNISLDEGGQINAYGQDAEGLLDEVQYGPYPEGMLRHTLGSPVPGLPGLFTSNETSMLLLDEVEAAAYTERLGEITLPSQFLWGRYDFVVPPGLGEDGYAGVSSAQKELVMFEGSGHSPMDNEPEAFVEAVSGFIDAL